MGFVFSFLIGFGILRILSGKQNFRPVDFFFSWGMGVGLASQITFFSILIGGRYRQEVLFLLAFVIVLWVWSIFFKNIQDFQYDSFVPHIIFFLILLSPLIIAQTYLHLNLPYGDWDAWSLWNYRANALFRSAGDWMPIYHNAIQGKHPWLVPHYIAWGWLFLGKESTWIPAQTALLMSCATVGLVVYALASWVGRWPALLAGLYLISIFYFNFHAAGQYASIFVAFFLLGSVVAVREYLRGAFIKVCDSGWLIYCVFS